MGFYGYNASLSGFAGLEIVGDASFSEQWSADDWRKKNWGSYWAADYTPPSSATVTRAQQQWQAMQDHLDLNSPLKGEYQRKMNAWRSDIQGWASIIDGNTHNMEYGNGRDAGNNLRVTYFSLINKALQDIAATDVPSPDDVFAASESAAEAEAARQKAAADAAAAAQAKAKADAAATTAKLQQTQDAVEHAKAAIAAASQAKAIAQASAQKNKELQAIAVQKSAATAKKVPWIVGGLVAVTAGAVYLARRKK